MQQLKLWIAIKQSTNLELKELVFGVGMKVKEFTHSQQQIQAPKLTKRSQQSDKLVEFWGLPP